MNDLINHDTFIKGPGEKDHIGMCGRKGYGFSAVLVINGVSILAYFDHFGH